MDTPTAGASIDEGAIDDRRKSATDRRISPRKKTLKSGQIIWDNGSHVKCTVRNVSTKDAKLEVHGLVAKNTFELIFDLDKSRRSCRVVWRKEPLIGVRFI
jgi:hypothetical protein